MISKQTKLFYLSELKDAPSVDVFRLVKFHGGVFPQLIQFQYGDPHLYPSSDFIPPAKTTSRQAKHQPGPLVANGNKRPSLSTFRHCTGSVSQVTSSMTAHTTLRHGLAGCLTDPHLPLRGVHRIPGGLTNPS